MENGERDWVMSELEGVAMRAKVDGRARDLGAALAAREMMAHAPAAKAPPPAEAGKKKAGRPPGAKNKPPAPDPRQKEIPGASPPGAPSPEVK